MNKFMRDGEYDQWALNLCVVAGARWPRGRLVEAGYQAETSCPRCGGAEETLMHRVWLCPSIRDHEGHEKSDALLPISPRLR
eukprot:8432957-Pyramimonas_sp.AAC.1